MENRINMNEFTKIIIALLMIGGMIIVGSRGFLYAAQGQEIVISVGNAQFTSLSDSGNHQVKVVANYTVSNSSMVGQKINAVMKVYSANGTLLKTTSFPSGFIVNKTGTQQLLTNLANSTLQNITAVTTFTNLGKTLALSNPLKVSLNLGQLTKGK